MSSITTIGKIEQSMQTITDMRISPFLPVSKIQKNSLLYKEFVKNNNILERKTPWGKIQLRNRLLSQYHNDILSGIMTLKNKIIITLESGEVVLLFSLYRLAQEMNIEWGGNTKKKLLNAILEIRDLVITRWDNEDNLLGTYNILRDVKYSNKYDKFGIILTQEYKEFFVNQITINFPNTYKKMREKIKGRGEGLIKAIINFFITQKENQKINLLKLLDTIGYPSESQRQINNAKEILNKNIELLKEFNIEYNKKDKIFIYTEELKDIKFINSKAEKNTK